MAVWLKFATEPAGRSALFVRKAEPQRLAGEAPAGRVVLVPPRRLGDLLRGDELLENFIGGRLGSRNPSAWGGVMTRTPSRSCASANCSCSCFILVQCTFGRK